MYIVTYCTLHHNLLYFAQYLYCTLPNNLLHFT